MFIQDKEKRNFNWAYRDMIDLPKLREAKVGDMFAAKNRDTREIEACYIRRLHKGKRHFQCVEGGGFVSPYDIESMHSNCEFTWYTKDDVSDYGQFDTNDIPNTVDYVGL